MRIATVLVFTALVCATQAELLPQLSNLGHSIGDKLKQLTQKLDRQIEQAEDRLQSSYKLARQKIEEVYLRVEDAAEGASGRVISVVDRLQENLQKQINKVAQNVGGGRLDVSSCTNDVAQSLRNIGNGVVSDVASCVTNKLQTAKEIVTDVLDRGQEGIDVITGIRTQAKTCLEGAKNLQQQASAVSCLMSVGSKTTWALSSKLPALAKDYARAVTLVTTLQPSLSLCLSKSSILSLAKPASALVTDVRKCIGDKLKAGIGSTVDSLLPTNPTTVDENTVAEVESTGTEEAANTAQLELDLPELEEVPVNQA